MLKIKINITLLYKEYKVKVKMVQSQGAQPKKLNVFIRLKHRNLHLVEGIKVCWESLLIGGIFLGGGRENKQIFYKCWTPAYSLPQ